MPDSIWYYARGETEKGPLSTAQMKTLAGAGKIRPEDLVWKEGMETWVPASEAPELFPNGLAKSKDKRPEAEEAAPTEPQPTPGGAAWRTVAAWRRLFHHAGRVAAGLGFFTVLLTRGCGHVSERYVARLQAAITVAEQQHRAEWNARQRRLAEETAALQALSNRTPAQQEQLRQLAAQSAEVASQAEESARQLRATKWEALRIAAETAEAENDIAAFGRSVLGLTATVCLAGGLLALAYTSAGPERWMSLAAIVALLLAIHIGKAGG